MNTREGHVRPSDLADPRQHHRRGRPADLVEAYTESMLGNRDRRPTAASRRGSGEIQITSVELFAGDGLQPVKRFRTGDDVRIRMHYRAEKPVPKPVFGFEIEALGGATVTSPCTRDVGLIPEASVGRGHDRGSTR